MKVEFKPIKNTKNTIKFEEKRNSELDSFKVGTIYIQKTALKELGYSSGQCVSLHIDLD